MIDTPQGLLDYVKGAPDGALLTPGEVAILMRVDPKTVTRWAAGGRVKSVRTPGGHRRFKVGDVRRLLEEVTSG